MKLLLVIPLFSLIPLFAEDMVLSCQVTQIAASEKEGKKDGKLKKILKFIEKDDSLKKYQSFKSLGKKSIIATKEKSGSLKLKNKLNFSLTAVSLNRAQRKNTVTVDISFGGNSDRKSFIDRNYLLIDTGALDAKSNLVIAVSCPVFP